MSAAVLVVVLLGTAAPGKGAVGPELGLRFSGETGRTGFPTVTARFSPGPDHPELPGAQIILPTGELLALNHLRSVCTTELFAGGGCPANSLHGRVRVWTLQSESPLQAPVYLRQSAGMLPDLAADLGGETALVAHLDTPHGRFRIRVDPLPDIQISRIALVLEGGSRGLFENSECLCGERRYAIATFSDQMGRDSTIRSRISTACGR